MPNKILIVDDAEIRNVLGIYLENEGYKIIKHEAGKILKA